MLLETTAAYVHVWYIILLLLLLNNNFAKSIFVFVHVFDSNIVVILCMLLTITGVSSLLLQTYRYVLTLIMWLLYYSVTTLIVHWPLEKVEGPSTSLTFLGIVLDTVRMEARLPTDKLHCIRHQVKTWLSKRRATKRQILSLVGLLQHATKSVCPGRTFLSQMYSLTAKLK